MPMQKLRFKPGINREVTSLTGEGGWYDGDKVRFRNGMPQKIGGWTPISTDTYLGRASSMFNWTTLKGYDLLSVGTNLKYYIESGGQYFDVTPIRETTAPGAVTFSAQDGSSIITVTDALNGTVDGDFVTFSGATGLGGNITAGVLNQEFQISFVSENIYTIDVSPVVANSSDVGNGGASTVAEYQINVGVTNSITLTAWGGGLWGGFSYLAPSTQLTANIDDIVTTIPVIGTGTFPISGVLLIGTEYISYSGKTATSFTGCVRGYDSSVAQPHLANDFVYDPAPFNGWGQSAIQNQFNQRLWSQANFGDYLIINPRGGALYLWVPQYTTTNVIDITNRAELLSPTSAGIYQTDTFCPTKCNIVMVSDASRFTICFGVTPIGSTEIDPLFIRWSDQETYSVWQPLATNQSGGYRLSNGSFIASAMQTRQEILVWTDAALYSMQYLGPPYIWGFNILASNISIASQNVTVTANNVAYWMGIDKFYFYTGRVDTLPCSIREYVFNDINLSQADQFFGGTNEGFGEIWWFYCSSDSLVVDRYVIFNYLEGAWSYGTLGRTAWLDSPVRQYPMAATYNGTVVFHENGNDDELTSGAALPIDAYIQSSDFTIGDGDRYGFVWQMIPDITFDGSNTPNPERPQVTMTLRPRRNPGAPYTPAPEPTVESNQFYGAGQGTYLVQEFTEVVHTRVRGRTMSMKIRSNTLGTKWELGVPMINIRPDGRR